MNCFLDPERGESFRLHVCGEVIAVEHWADGSRSIKFTLALEHQDARYQCGVLGCNGRTGVLEFTDDECLLKFIRPSKSKGNLTNE